MGARRFNLVSSVKYLLSANQEPGTGTATESTAISAIKGFHPRCPARQNMTEAQMSPRRRRKGGQGDQGRLPRGRGRARKDPQPALPEVPHSQPLPQAAWQIPTPRLSGPKVQPPHLPVPAGRREAKHLCPDRTLPQRLGHVHRKGPGHLRTASPEPAAGGSWRNCALQLPQGPPRGAFS